LAYCLLDVVELFAPELKAFEVRLEFVHVGVNVVEEKLLLIAL
jgi:hypothetical protein